MTIQKTPMNQSGQGFSVFRLLISAIMGLMILMIILGVYDYFNQQRVNLGYQRILERFETAINKADGTIIVVENAELAPGEITSFSLAQGKDIQKDCIIITGQTNTNNFTILSESVARINTYSNINVYLKCETNMEGCETYCTVSLNKKISTD